MKYYELDNEEQEISDALERGEVVLVPEQEKFRREAVEAAKSRG